MAAALCSGLLLLGCREAPAREAPVFRQQPPSLSEAERAYLTQFAESEGIGQVRGLGGSADPQVDVESTLRGVFAELGMSESAANFAAKGRG